MTLQAAESPSDQALRLASEARKAKAESQRQRRLASALLAECERVCKAHGINFELIHHQKEGKAKS